MEVIVADVTGMCFGVRDALGVLAGVADRKMTAFPQALKGAEWTGNPVRGDIASLADPEARYARRSGPLKLLVVGGSGGAQALNECVPRALALLQPRPSVVHQSGEKNYAALRAAYTAAGVQGELVPFIDDMARRYAEADLVICRAGAMTVAELSAGGVASVLNGNAGVLLNRNAEAVANVDFGGTRAGGRNAFSNNGAARSRSPANFSMGAGPPTRKAERNQWQHGGDRSTCRDAAPDHALRPAAPRALRPPDPPSSRTAWPPGDA